MSMLDFLRGKASERKLRLFACACDRQIGLLLNDPERRRAVKRAEQYADSNATDHDLEEVWAIARYAGINAARAPGQVAMVQEAAALINSAADAAWVGDLVAGIGDRHSSDFNRWYAWGGRPAVNPRYLSDCPAGYIEQQRQTD
jgi:hypothetical protein